MNEGRMLYELLSQLTDEQICEKVENFISDEYGKLDISEQEKVSEIEYLCDKEPQLAHIWFERVQRHYKLDLVDETNVWWYVILEYLYIDWQEATLHFYRYGSIVGDMLKQYANEINKQYWGDSEYDYYMKCAKTVYSQCHSN